MAGERLGSYEIPEGTPIDNYEGLHAVDIAELGKPYRGKVADNWVLPAYKWNLPEDQRLIVRTDRKSAFNRKVGSIAGIGVALNLLSAWWFEKTKDVLPNHLIAVPHPNAMIVREAAARSPIEWIFRRLLFETTSKTSVWVPYSKGERNIYGQDFPDGLKPNQKFPRELGRNGIVFTPTTKDDKDTPLTPNQARKMFEEQFGGGRFDEVLDGCYSIFEYAEGVCDSVGLQLIDTKMEVALDARGNIMLIDELLNQDASRFGRKSTYQARFEAGEDLDIYDKELLRKWLADREFNMETPQVPVMDQKIKDQMRAAYQVPLRLLTGGRELTQASQSSEKIREAFLAYIQAV